MKDKKTGTFWRVPYDWRTPSWQRIRTEVWNPEGDQIMVPKAYGWGYGVNLHALLRRVGLLRKG